MEGASTVRVQVPARWGGWRWSVLAFGVVLVLALVLRGYAVGWGLPYTDHPDEPAVANTVLGMVRYGDWNPRFFDYPSLFFYALRPVFEAHWRYGLATGLYHDVSQLPRTTDVYTTAPGFFIWGRLFIAFVGALTAALLCVIGRRFWSGGVGVAAAVVLAVQPFHMRHSQFMTMDVPSALMTLLTVVAAMRLLGDSRWRMYALAGFVSGLAGSTKYNAAVVVIAICVAHVLCWEQASVRQLPRLMWAGLWSVIGFVVASPYVVLSFGSFLAGLGRQFTDYGSGTRGDVVGHWPMFDYVDFLWSTGLYPPAFVAALVGIGVVIARRDRAGLVMLGFTGCYVLFFLSHPQHFLRNLMPVLPLLALFAGIGVVWVSDWVRMQLRDVGMVGDGASRARVFVWGVPLVVLVVVAVWPLAKAIELTRFEARAESKVVAGDFVRDQLPRGAPIAVMLHPFQWANEPFVIPVRYVEEHEPGWYRAQGFRYVVMDVRESSAAGYRRFHAWGQVAMVFPGDRGGQPGPRLEVLDLGFRPDDLAIERSPALFGGWLRFLGFQRGAGDLRPAFRPLDGEVRVTPGKALLLNLYWQPLVRPDADYAVFLHLLGADGETVARRDTLIRGGDYPMSRWRPGELVVDLADLPLPADLPAGRYRLELGVYRMDTMRRLAVPGTQGDALQVLTVDVS